MTTWNKDMLSRAQKLLELGYTYTDIADRMIHQYGGHFSHDSVRNQLRRHGKTAHTVKKEQDNRNGTTSKKVKTTYKSDDTISTTINSLFKDKQEFTKAQLLELAGLNPKEFELQQVKGSEWSIISTKEGRRWNYASSIIAKPKAVDMDAIAKYLGTRIKPYPPLSIAHNRGDAGHYLVVPLFDTHFGSSSFDTYKQALSDQLEHINEHDYQESVLILGGDILHVDSVNNTTTKGTQLDSTDVVGMVDDALHYLEPLLNALAEASKRVKVISVAGNHDYTMSYMLAKIIQQAFSNYTNIDWDIDLYDHYKAVLLGNNFIGATHGDKGKKNYVSIYASQFAPEWAQAKNRELFTGHLHNELDRDLGGIFQRQCSTLKPDDQWTRDLGVVSRNSLFMVEYSQNATKSVLYVG